MDNPLKRLAFWGNVVYNMAMGNEMKTYALPLDASVVIDCGDFHYDFVLGDKSEKPWFTKASTPRRAYVNFKKRIAEMERTSVSRVDFAVTDMVECV